MRKREILFCFFILVLLKERISFSLPVQTAFWRPYTLDPDTYVIFHFDKDLSDCEPEKFLLKRIENVELFYEGKFGHCAKFNEKGVIIFTPEIIYKGTYASIVSIEGWVKLEKYPDNEGFLVFKKGIKEKSYGFSLSITNKGSILMKIVDLKGAIRTILSDEKVVPLNVWVHIAGISLGRIFVNGKQINIREMKGNINLKLDEKEPSQIFIGNDETGENGIIGFIDEIRIHRSVCKLWEPADISWTKNTIKYSIEKNPPYFIEGHQPVFYISFDNGTIPEINRIGEVKIYNRFGELKITESKDDNIFSDGIKGKCIDCKKNGLGIKGKLFDIDEGSLELWFEPVGFNNYHFGTGIIESSSFVVYVMYWGVVTGEPIPLSFYFYVSKNRNTLIPYIIEDKKRTEIYEGNWYHLVITWREEEIKMYINGVLAGMGDRYKLQKPVEGIWFQNIRLDEVYFYNKALTPEEVSNCYYRYREPSKLKEVSQNPFDYKIKYYPSLNKIFYRIFPNKEGIENIIFEIFDKKTNKRVFKKEVPFGKEGILQIPDLDGEYILIASTKINNEIKKSTSFYLKREHFPWEKNKVGVVDNVLPPFKPIKIENNKVKVVLREYTLNGIGLLDSIKAQGNVSAGPLEELLASPIVLKIDEGEELKGKGKFTIKKDSIVIYEGSSSNEKIRIRIKTTIEYDGCIKVEVFLLPGISKDKVLKKLWLEIPLKDEMVSLMHISGTSSLRENPAGNIPKGEGVIWDSKKFYSPQHWMSWFGNFIPYIWLGGEERGLCWFADNDKGWVIDWDRQPPCLVLEREGGILRLKVNLVQKPIKIEEVRHIVFGLMASPAKPMPDNWRLIHSGPRYKDYPRLCWMGSEYWGSDANFCSKYPLNGDFSVLDKVKELRLGLPVDKKSFLKEYEERNLKSNPKLLEKKPEQILGLIDWTLNWAKEAGSNCYTTAYWEEFIYTNPLHREVETFKHEWSGQFGYGSTGGIVSSYIDFATWYAKEFVKRGVGLYFDNTFPYAFFDPLTSSAYKLPDGSIQPTAGIWARREYLKRIWIIHKTESDPKMPVCMMLHMTNTLILPYMVWCDAILDLEWRYGPKPAQERFSPELLRTETIGRQVGSIPFALSNQEGDPKTQFGMLIVHEVKPINWSNYEFNNFKKMLDFGYGSKDCEVYNYWDKKYPIKFSDEKVKSILLKKNKEMLLILCSWNSNPEEVKVNIDTNLLKLEPTIVEDLENIEITYRVENNSFLFPLKGYDVRILRIK